MSESFHNARTSIACLRAAPDDPPIAGSAERLEPVGRPADSSPGFARRLQDQQRDATTTGAGIDARILFEVAP